MKAFSTLTLIILPGFLMGQSIEQYRSVLLLLQNKLSNTPTEIAIRSFIRDTQQVFLIVQPDSMYTHVEPARNYTVNATTWRFLRKQWAERPYIKAIVAAGHRDAFEHNAGIDGFKTRDKGISLTVDLCPSHKPLDKRIFMALITACSSNELPVPIGLAISGQWLLFHPDDLKWLKSLVDQKEIDLTWINHTRHHHFNKDLPLDKNFLLSMGTDIKSEVLGNEELMLKQGILPSCFFRFPGLISTKRVFDQILDWGLIPIGTDAWLAKGQYPKASGSIVLIHANGNEPIGVEVFIRLLQKKNSDLNNGQWKMLDLRDELSQ